MTREVGSQEMRDLQEENRKYVDRFQQMQKQVTELLKERSMLSAGACVVAPGVFRERGRVFWGCARVYRVFLGSFDSGVSRGRSDELEGAAKTL